MAQDVLQEAAALIKSGKRAEARTLLVRILRENQDNAGAWWLLAYAAPNKDIAGSALEQVRRLYPDNPRVLQALEKVVDKAIPTPTLGDLLADESQYVMADEPDEPFEPVDEMDTWLDIAEKRKRDEYFERVKERPRPYSIQQYGVTVFLVFVGLLVLVSALNRFNAFTGDGRAAVICDTAEGTGSALDATNHPADTSLTLPENVIHRSELALNSRFEQIPLDTADEKHAYIYNASGDVRVRVVIWAMDHGINPTLAVYDVDGHQFAFCDDFAIDNSGLLLDVRLPSAGLYTFVVYQANPAVAGDYGMTFEAAD